MAALYTVTKRGGEWGIRANDASFLRCANYVEALQTAMAAAKLLTDRSDGVAARAGEYGSHNDAEGSLIEAIWTYIEQ